MCAGREGMKIKGVRFIKSEKNLKSMGEKLFTGFVRAAGYARKVRKALFAALKNKVEAKEVVRASAELNQKIFEKMQEMQVDKSDVVTIEVGFEVKNGKIEWNYDSLRIEVFKKEEEEKLSKAMEEVEKIENELENAIEELHHALQEVEDAMSKLKDIATRIKQEFGKHEEEE